MSTNYYVNLVTSSHCPHCLRPPVIEQLHTGTSCGGWCFALHVIPERGLNDLLDWLILIASEPDTTIENEYSSTLTLEELLRVITQRSHVQAFEHHIPGVVPGPNGLVRAPIDGQRCIGHGVGTWDLIVGDFS